MNTVIRGRVAGQNTYIYTQVALPVELGTPSVLDRSLLRLPHLPFYWKPHKKGSPSIQPRDMATSYLFNTIRMIFNNSVPPAFRVGEFKRYDDIPRWDSEYRTQAITELSNEIAARDDLDGDLWDELKDMIYNARTILLLGL